MMKEEMRMKLFFFHIRDVCWCVCVCDVTKSDVVMCPWRKKKSKTKSIPALEGGMVFLGIPGSSICDFFRGVSISILIDFEGVGCGYPPFFFSFSFSSGMKGEGEGYRGEEFF